MQRRADRHGAYINFPVAGSAGTHLGLFRLHELAAERNWAIKIYRVNGRVMSMTYERIDPNVRRYLDDLLLASEQPLHDLAVQVAREQGLADGWLFDCVRAEPPDSVMYSKPHLSISDSMPHIPLILKARAARDCDREDFLHLLDAAGYRGADEAIGLNDRTFQRMPMRESSKSVLRDWVRAHA